MALGLETLQKYLRMLYGVRRFLFGGIVILYIRVWYELLLCAGMDVLRTPKEDPRRGSSWKNSPLDCFSYFSCASPTLGISRPAGRDSGLCPKTPQGLLALDLASLSEKGRL